MSSHRRAAITGATVLALVSLMLWQGFASAAPAEPTFTAACTNQATVASWTNISKLRLLEILWYTTTDTSGIADGHLNSNAAPGDYLQANGNIQTTVTFPGAVKAVVGWAWLRGSTSVTHNEIVNCTTV